MDGGIAPQKNGAEDEVVVKYGLAFWECFLTHPREFLLYMFWEEEKTLLGFVQRSQGTP
jgi:hypothetical protein